MLQNLSAIRDEKLQATAEQIRVWNFAKKARKVITVLKDELEAEKSPETQEDTRQKLDQAMKYAGVSFSPKERQAFLELVESCCSKRY